MLRCSRGKVCSHAFTVCPWASQRPHAWDVHERRRTLRGTRANKVSAVREHAGAIKFVCCAALSVCEGYGPAVIWRLSAGFNAVVRAGLHACLAQAGGAWSGGLPIGVGEVPAPERRGRTGCTAGGGRCRAVDAGCSLVSLAAPLWPVRGRAEPLHSLRSGHAPAQATAQAGAGGRGRGNQTLSKYASMHGFHA